MSAPRVVFVATTIVLLIAAVIIFTVRSGETPSESPDVRKPDDGKVRIIAGEAKVAKSIDHMKVSILTPSRQVTLGETVRFNITIDNTSTQSRELTFNTSQTIDIRAEDASGSEIWRWSEHQMFAQMLQAVTIGPGESLSYAAEWPMKDSSGKLVKPGIYTVFGSIMANETKDEEVAIEITIKKKK